MNGSITITLPEEVENALEEAMREEGVPEGELIRKALADYLFIRKFRLLREHMRNEAPEDWTDEDIFEQVS